MPRTKNICGGNSHQRRKLRRHLNRVANPLVQEGMPLNQVAIIAGVPFQTLYKHISREGFIKSRWMYRKPIQQESAA
jgi:hypothetical protein